MFNEIYESAFTDELEKIASTVELLRRPVQTIAKGVSGSAKKFESMMPAPARALIRDPKFVTEQVMSGLHELDVSHPGKWKTVLKDVQDAKRMMYQNYGKEQFQSALKKGFSGFTPKHVKEIQSFHGDQAKIMEWGNQYAKNLGLPRLDPKQEHIMQAQLMGKLEKYEKDLPPGAVANAKKELKSRQAAEVIAPKSSIKPKTVETSKPAATASTKNGGGGSGNGGGSGSALPYIIGGGAAVGATGLGYGLYHRKHRNG